MPAHVRPAQRWLSISLFLVLLAMLLIGAWIAMPDGALLIPDPMVAP